VAGGEAISSSGGDIELRTGYSMTSSSGQLTLSADHSGVSGSSGDVFVTTGSAQVDNSGSINMRTGDAFYGMGGEISLAVCLSMDTFYGAHGGSVSITAGETRSSNAWGGGDVSIIGDGGNVDMMVGAGTMDALET